MRSIAARAIPLSDRRFLSEDQGLLSDAVKCQHRLARWQEIIGSAKILNRRLRSSDISPHDVKNQLGGAQGESEFPSWASLLASVLHPQPSSSELYETGSVTDSSFDPRQPLPFQEILVGFVRHAREQLRTEAGEALKVFRSSAIVDLERQLLAHLTFVASTTIGHDFYKFRFERAPASAIESAWCQQKPSTEIYSAYVCHMLDAGLIELLDAYPVLARLLSQSVEQWTRACVNLCRRFLEEFSDLKMLFNWRRDQPWDAVEHLRTDLSDRHNGGQTVIEFILCTHERVIYKPRTVRPEMAFYGFITWLNNRGLSLDLKVIRMLDRGTHGWVEFVACNGCRSDAEVERFYVRAGMLLCVFYVLAATDVHCENLIACGEYPVAIDLETLLSDSVQESQTSQSRQDGLRDEPSVLNSGFLPGWQDAPDGRRYDMSALGADKSQDPGIRLPAWQSINTDQMMFSEDKRVAAAMSHRVRREDTWPTVADHLVSFLEGFKQVYSCLLTQRQELSSNDRMLSEFDCLELRVLLRNSATYARLHLHSLHPEFLKDGIDRSIELEWLAKPLSGTTTPQKGRIQIYETERTAMENLDIPHFPSSAWRNMDHTSDDPDLLHLGLERDSRVVRRRLANLSESDCMRQIAAIEDAVRSRFANV
jgi:type 2 lantibiotic biosynthesis protein LanM